MTRSCVYQYLDCVDYWVAWDLQRGLAGQVADGKCGDTLLLLEHPPVYTLGHRSKAQDLLLPREALEALGATVLEVDRGGEITFHGPGQLVAYPIIRLGQSTGPREYVAALEKAIIDVLAEFGVAGGRIPGLTGVWVGEEKVAAIGVRITRGVTTHGLALNVNTDLSWFEHIVPCGIQDRGVTSLQRLLGKPLDLLEVASVAAGCLGQALKVEMVKAKREELLLPI